MRRKAKIKRATHQRDVLGLLTFSGDGHVLVLVIAFAAKGEILAGLQPTDDPLSKCGSSARCVRPSMSTNTHDTYFYIFLIALIAGCATVIGRTIDDRFWADPSRFDHPKFTALRRP